MNLKLLLVSSLEKVFPDEEPRAFSGKIEGFLNETASFQAAWRDMSAQMTHGFLCLRVESPIAQYVRARRVRFVPVLFPVQDNVDDNYLRKTPGLYPDPLTPFCDRSLRAWTNHWESVWFDVEAGGELPAGTYPIEIVLETREGVEVARARCEYRRIGAQLPPQTLIHTKWFHADGLCTCYNVPMFSEPFWAICENYVRAMARRGINMLLTPVHTPPLDTAVGGERITCQLVDIEKNGDAYTFGFDKLKRWVDMATRCGIRYFEIAHLFTQWGAKFAPKIVALVDGLPARVFGWDTPATSPEYLNFLDQYLPALKNALRDLGVLDKCYFHISDEPHLSVLENYMTAKNAVEKHLEGLHVIDALSDIQLYESGAVKKPVPANNHIRPFLEAKIPGLWTYYCIGQCRDVSNTFAAMPSARTRILGVQLYKYNIEGFLQWGYNFYNSQYSEYPVNPFLTNDGDGFSPTGDCFQVYPGHDGQPFESIRMMTMAEAIFDMRALQMLESLRGREFAMRLVEDGVAPIEFDSYPKSPNYILSLRRRVNAEIEKALAE